MAPVVRSTITLRDLIASNVRRLRTEAGVTVDMVSKAATDFGLDWSPTWLNALERGQRALSAEQLLALPLVLGHAFSHAVSLADLLGGEGRVRLKVAPRNAKSSVPAQRKDGDPVDPAATEDTHAVELSGLREAATAIPLRRPFSGPAEKSDAKSAPEQAADKMRAISKANLGNIDIRALNKAEAGAGDLEQKLARKLGVAEIVVIAACASLWGHAMVVERDKQMLEPDAPVRNMLTRNLNEAVTKRIEDAASGLYETEAPRWNGQSRQEADPAEAPVEAAPPGEQGLEPYRQHPIAPPPQPAERVFSGVVVTEGDLDRDIFRRNQAGVMDAPPRRPDAPRKPEPDRGGYNGGYPGVPAAGARPDHDRPQAADDFDDYEQPWRPDGPPVRYNIEESTVILPLVRPREEDDTVVLYFPSGIFDQD